MQNHPTPTFPIHEPPLEQEIRQTGEALFALMDQHPEPGIFSTKGAYARLMEWSMKDPDFKARLFRFVDVLPCLDSSADVVRHLQEYLGDQAAALNPALRAGLGAAGFAPGLVAGPIRSQVQAMASQFVAGEGPEDLLKRFRANAKAGMATTIDLLGETVLSEAEADHFLQRNLEVLGVFAAEMKRDGTPCASDIGPGGVALPRINLSVKISALSPEVQPAAPEPSIEALKKRLRPVLREAAKVGAFVNFDMESFRMKDLTLALFRSVLEEPEFAQAPGVGIALQAYLRSCEDDIDALLAWARKRGRVIGVRLVKGAYWDSETILAAQRDWPTPVWSRKEESDANFEKLTEKLLRAGDCVLPAFATHNVRSCAHAIALARKLGVEPARIEFQALYGMADDLKHALRAQGWRVREYCAIGALLPGMAYLVRRLLENTSNEGFLRNKAEGATRSRLLASPAEALRAAQPAADAPKTETATAAAADVFRNAANSDYTLEARRVAMRQAIEKRRAMAPKTHPLLIRGRAVRTARELVSTNPAHPSTVVGRSAAADITHADEALEAARAAFPAWSRTEPQKRAAVLDRAAAIIEARRDELNALMVIEAGKPWIEADGELSEAVDFCRFYAHEMRRMGVPATTQDVPGEWCTQVWLPRGVGVVVAPWNFPFAILCGMTVAPIVAGNCVIVKPSQLTPVIAATFAEILQEAGLPDGVLALLNGEGRTLGARLCESPKTDFIVFTGSRAVGCALWEVAGRCAPGQTQLKRMVCEMGGKNALIVDADADLDEAIPAIIQSAFSYAGQKCSALSRLIVHGAVHDKLLARLAEACASLPVGDPADPATVVGPVIDAVARARILECIEAGKKEATLHWQGVIPAAAAQAGGHYVPPTIFRDVKPGHRLAREEIFGPVLAVLRARDLDEAIELANDCDYALTGGMFSRSPSSLERARRELQVGNLYLNRGITGAIVERHPFGGYRMSGGGTKAGGRGYLENFMVQRSIAENVLRRGFAPPSAAKA